MEVVKELDSVVDIDIKGFGFVKTEKASTRSETANSLSMKTIREVSPEENNKDSGKKILRQTNYFFSNLYKV